LGLGFLAGYNVHELRLKKLGIIIAITISKQTDSNPPAGSSQLTGNQTILLFNPTGIQADKRPRYRCIVFFKNWGLACIVE